MLKNQPYELRPIGLLENSLISLDHHELYTVFYYLSININYSSTCLTGLKVLEIGCGAGEYCKSALNHGAQFVLGLDISTYQINLAKMDFAESEVPESCYLFEKSDYLHEFAMCREIINRYSSYFDKAMSFWTLSMAKNTSEVLEIVKNVFRLIKNKGDAVFLVVNPGIIEHFQTFKSLPRIENMEFTGVEECEDYFLLTCNILEPYSSEIFMEVKHNVYSLDQLKKIFSTFNLEIKHSGPLDLVPEDDQLALPFKSLSREISKEYSLGWFIHVKKP